MSDKKMMPETIYPVCFGVAGTVLLAEEREFFTRYAPLGFILFARNIESPEQTRQLVSDLRELVGWHCPVLIDQEGGRVARLKPPHWPSFPSMDPFREKALTDMALAEKMCFENAEAIALELDKLGIDVDCAPVCDLRMDGAHDIVGDRSFGGDPEVVAQLAQAMADGFKERHVFPVIKHIPGHGRAMVDSHESLPTVDTDVELLRETDFLVFKSLSHLPFAMTAHIVYSSIDANNPATFSATVIHDVIRGEIGFDGVLMSDDLSMKALAGDMSSRAERAMAAGCDMVLHCNGKLEEMQDVIQGLRVMSEEGRVRFMRCYYGDKNKRAVNG